MSVYSLTRLTQTYNGRTVLDIPRLEIRKDRIYALVGPNGAGKTTLLNILAFLQPPTKGDIHYRLKPVRYTSSELKILRRQVILVNQSPVLFTTTVFKNLEFGLKVRKIRKQKRIRMIAEALDLIGMEAFATVPAHTLSGGETQRVALARALILSPRVLLCDEPTASVDVENQAIIVDIFKQINATKRITIIFTTHDRSQATQLSHHTLMLDHGRLVRVGYENIFSGTVDQRGDGKALLTIHPDVSLYLESVAGRPVQEVMRIFIDPDKIKPVQKNMGPIPPNVLKGRVQQITAENAKIRMVVDTGVQLTLMMSTEAYRASRILAGDKIDLVVPSDAIRFIEGG